MTFEEALFSYLTTHPTAGPVLGERIYPVAAPQGVDFPFVTYSKTDGARARSGSGPTDSQTATYLLSAWAKTWPKAREAARALLAALDDLRDSFLGVSDVALGEVIAEDTRDDYNPDLELFGRTIELTIQYREG